uniref:distal tail protein Dit n=1 Tax=Carnobacterium maltaromaticum TaxID=2751 RepID=UPI0039AFD097
MLSVIFDGHELNEFLDVTVGFERGVGTSRKNDLLRVGNSDGSKYRGHRLEENSFTMPFVLRYDLNEKRRKLAAILNVNEPKKLIFGDEPDKYYLAIPGGKVGLSENNFLGKGSIEWII